MNRFFAMVAALLRAMPKMVMERIKIGGEWVTRLVTAPLVGGDAPMPAAAPEPTVKIDAEMAVVRAVADCVMRDQIPSPDLSGKIPQQQFDWLCACSNDMLRTIIRADDKSLRDHVRGRRSLRGVLVNDVDTVQAFLQSAPTETELAAKRSAIDEAQDLLNQPRLAA